MVFFLSFFLIYLSECRNVLGVPPSMAQIYEDHINEKTQTFRCFDESKEIPLSKLNDNYKDCPDGSDEPGTSHGNPSQNFYCANNNYLPIEIPRWSVGDGICDCCDGSDESFNSHSNCNNTCKEMENQRLHIREQLSDIYKDGLKQKQELIESGKVLVDTSNRKKEKYETKIKKYENKIKKIKSGSKTPTPAPSPHVPDEFGQWDKTEEAQKPTPTPEPTPIYKKKKHLGFILNLWRLVFFVDKDDIAFSEVFMKQKDGRIKLYKSKIQGWKTKKSKVDSLDDFTTKGIPIQYSTIVGQEFKLDSFTFSFMEELKDDSYSLGRFKSYKNETGTEELFFSDGTRCWQTQSGRKTTVKLLCSNVNKLIKVIETSTCEFLATFSTPAACSDEMINSIENMTVPQLEEIKGQLNV